MGSLNKDANLHNQDQKAAWDRIQEDPEKIGYMHLTHMDVCSTNTQIQTTILTSFPDLEKLVESTKMLTEWRIFRRSSSPLEAMFASVLGWSIYKMASTALFFSSLTSFSYCFCQFCLSWFNPVGNNLCRCKMISICGLLWWYLELIPLAQRGQVWLASLV